MEALVVVYGYSFVRCLGLTLGLFCNFFLIVRIIPISFACFYLRPCGFGILCLSFLILLTVDFKYNRISIHCIDVMRFKTGMTDDLCFILNWI